MVTGLPFFAAVSPASERKASAVGHRHTVYSESSRERKTPTEERGRRRRRRSFASRLSLATLPSLRRTHTHIHTHTYTPTHTLPHTRSPRRIVVSRDPRPSFFESPSFVFLSAPLPSPPHRSLSLQSRKRVPLICSNALLEEKEAPGGRCMDHRQVRRLGLFVVVREWDRNAPHSPSVAMCTHTHTHTHTHTQTHTHTLSASCQRFLSPCPSASRFSPVVPLPPSLSLAFVVHVTLPQRNASLRTDAPMPHPVLAQSSPMPCHVVFYLETPSPLAVAALLLHLTTPSSLSVVGFLASPVWLSPLQTFVERECLIFDAEEENKLEYTPVHNHYRELVEGLLEGFLHGRRAERQGGGGVGGREEWVCVCVCPCSTSSQNRMKRAPGSTTRPESSSLTPPPHLPNRAWAYRRAVCRRHDRGRVQRRASFFAGKPPALPRMSI